MIRRTIPNNPYTGKELNRKHIHSASGQTTHTEVYTYEYDTADRLKAVRHKLDNYTQATLCSLAYDDIGRNSTKALMNNTEAVGYTYNIRDWQRKIQSTHFTENIGYNDTSGGIVPTNKYHNGNIGAVSWLAGNETMYRSYDFSYDAFDRLEYASYTGSMDYNTYYTYDGMGNLTEVMRYGGGNSSVMVDDLEIEYSGNQMVCVDDNATDPSNYGTFNFFDGASQSVEYEYDKNGNMTKDLNKNISSVQYNLLNLPQNITYGTGKSAAYVYDAGGRKLRTSYKASASATAVPTDYCGNMIYEDNVLKQVLVDGGYVTFSGSTPVYHYYLQDHLGNNRVVCNASGTVEQVNHYYPFGGLFAEGTGGDVQRYKYNGKELDRTHGLDWYDYGARHMSPDVGRFTTIDPMAEKYYNISPYAYCANNPILFVDYNGSEPTTKEAALMAKHVYGDKVKLIGGWKASKIQNPSFISDSSLKSALYERTIKGVTEYAYVTAGTQDIDDIYEDIGQLVGETKQYEESVNNAMQLSTMLGNSELTFVGHSLGGGLAAANALMTDKNAITFNAAAISSQTKNKLNLPRNLSKGRIFNVVVDGEIVNYLQSKIGLSLEGGMFKLPASYLPGKSILNTYQRVKNHSIDTVIKKIDEEEK